MDMNEILDQWDKIQREQKSNASASKHTGAATGKKANADHVVSGGKQNGTAASSKQNGATASSKQNTATASIQQSSTKKSSTPSAPKINPMIAWMNRYGVVDKDKMLDEAFERSKMESHTYLREMKAEAVIDLHGLTADEATAKLTFFVDVCERKGLRKILIVHGKGNHSKGTDPVLGNLVRRFIEFDSRLGMSGHPDRTQGGSGATWVIIKK